MRPLLALMIVIASPLPAIAQEGPALELEVGAREARDIDAEALREAIARELGIEVVMATRRRRDLPRVRVRVVAHDRASLELVRGDGSRMRRSTELPTDAGERLDTIVILAVNMVRDEASELLELLRNRRATPAEPEVEAPVEEPVPAAATEVAPPDPALVASTEPTAPTGVPPVTPEVTGPAPRSEAPPVGAPPAAPAQRVFRLGLGGLIGSVPRGSGTDATFVGGLELAWTPTDFLAFGIRDLGGGAPIGTNGAWSAGAAVFGEIGWVVDPALVLHLELGLDIRALVNDDAGSAGLAPLILLGARWFPIREVSLAAQTALHIVATDAWSTNLHLMPSGAVFWSGGLTVAVHVS